MGPFSVFAKSAAHLLATPIKPNRSSVRAHDQSVDDHVLKATTPSQVEALRAALIKQIWGVKWNDVLQRQPTQTRDHYSPTPDDTLPTGLAGLDRIERILTTMSEAQTGGGDVVHTSTAFIFHPVAPNGRFVVVHHGHGCRFDGLDGPYNLDLTIRELVVRHYAVAAVRMPLYQTLGECGHDLVDSSHDALMQRRLVAGSPARFFLEPVARILNYAKMRHPIYNDFHMIGLSGGGWTTTLYPAIDTRVRKSFPVAGSIPLYLRGHNYNDDREQYDSSIYAIAGYKDLYVMGGYGEGRLQTQILNRFDNCCFGEAQHTVAPPPFVDAVRSYSLEVADTFQKLGKGGFLFFMDTEAHTHQIAADALQGIIIPLLETDTPFPRLPQGVFNASRREGPPADPNEATCGPGDNPRGPTCQHVQGHKNEVAIPPGPGPR